MATPTCSLKQALYLLSLLATFTLQVDATGLHCYVCAYAESHPHGFKEACSVQRYSLRTCNSIRDAAEATELIDGFSRNFFDRTPQEKNRFIQSTVETYRGKGYNTATCAKYEERVRDEPFVFHTCMATTEAVRKKALKGPHCIEGTDIFRAACVCSTYGCTENADFSVKAGNGAAAMDLMGGRRFGLFLLTSTLGFLFGY